MKHDVAVARVVVNARRAADQRELGGYAGNASHSCRDIHAGRCSMGVAAAVERVCQPNNRLSRARIDGL